MYIWEVEDCTKNSVYEKLRFFCLTEIHELKKFDSDPFIMNKWTNWTNGSLTMAVCILNRELE